MITVQNVKVSGVSDPRKLAGFIANSKREGKEINIVGIGAGSINQAVKSVAIANSFLAANAVMLAMLPGFTTIEQEDGEEVTGVEIQLSEYLFAKPNGQNGYAELKVSSRTNANSLADTVVELIKDEQPLVMRVIGAGAVNQTVKGVAVANKRLAPDIRLKIIPGFSTFLISEDEEKTGMELKVSY